MTVADADVAPARERILGEFAPTISGLSVMATRMCDIDGVRPAVRGCGSARTGGW